MPKTANIDNEWMKENRVDNGVMMRDRIVKPSEIYTELKAKEILNRSFETLDAVYTLFKSLNMDEMEDVLEEMERCLKR